MFCSCDSSYHCTCDASCHPSAHVGATTSAYRASISYGHREMDGRGCRRAQGRWTATYTTIGARVEHVYNSDWTIVVYVANLIVDLLLIDMNTL